MTLYRAEIVVIDEIENKHKEQFENIRDTAFSIPMSNPGSHAVVYVDSIPGDQSVMVFGATFITFPVMINGLLKGYRANIGMDG